MRRIFINIGVFVLGGLFLSGGFDVASAQDMQAQPQAEARAPDKMDKVPDEYIEEADAFYGECMGDYMMSQYYNCECMSVEYLEERIKNGPLMVASQIKQNLQNKCRDAVGAAGPTYQECLSKANRFSPGTDPEKYCECVANTYVKDISRNAPFLDSRSLVGFKVQAYSACNNPQDRR